jgi:hypothetical protein
VSEVRILSGPQRSANLAERLLAFQDRYNATAEPFNWRFGRKSPALSPSRAWPR